MRKCCNYNDIRYQNVNINNSRKDKRVNIPVQIKAALSKKKNAGQGFISNAEDDY